MKLLTMYRSLHPKADVDRLYWKRNNDEKGLISVQECVRIEKTRTTTNRSSNAKYDIK